MTEQFKKPPEKPSYTQIVSKNIKQHSPLRPWRRGAANFSVVFDVTNIYPPHFNSAVREIFPHGVGRALLEHKEGNQKLVEIVCNSEEACQDAVKKGVTVDGHHLLPTRTLPPDAEVVTVHLTKLPVDSDPEEIKKQLFQVLAVYGEVLEVALHTEVHGGWYLGTGVATLNITSKTGFDQAKSYHPLTHEMPWFNEKIFRATWKAMPLYCRYCHKEGHVLAKCPVRPGTECWTCGEKGHLSTNCSHDRRLNSRKKTRQQAHTPKKGVQSQESAPPREQHSLQKPSGKTLTTKSKETDFLEGFVNDTLDQMTTQEVNEIFSSTPTSMNNLMEQSPVTQNRPVFSYITDSSDEDMEMETDLPNKLPESTQILQIPVETGHPPLAPTDGPLPVRTSARANKGVPPTRLSCQ